MKGPSDVFWPAPFGWGTEVMALFALDGLGSITNLPVSPVPSEFTLSMLVAVTVEMVAGVMPLITSQGG